MRHDIDIEPVSITAIRAAQDGVLVEVDNDVQGVLLSLREIDSRFCMYYSTEQEVFVVYTRDGDRENFVGAYPELDHRIVRRAREYALPGYNLADEIDQIQQDADDRQEHERREILGAASEELAFAVKKDLGRHEQINSLKSRAFIPRAFRPDAP